MFDKKRAHISRSESIKYVFIIQGDCKLKTVVLLKAGV
jgi:hypothetical protein